MADSKFKIKPIHLVSIGLTIIILGILIPSFFISAFSTIGFAVIIGSFILLSAYAFFAVNLVKSKGKKTIKWLILPIVLGLLVVGGFYANNKYNEYQANKIYAVGDTIELPGFTFKITEATTQAVPLGLDDVNLADRKDCTGLNRDSQEYHDCDWYNWPRRNAQNYINNYDRATISYELTAKSIVSADGFSISILPSSGREIKTGSTDSGDEFSFLWVLGSELNGDHRSLEYQASPRSDFGGDVMRGITRDGWVGADLKKSERTYDVIVRYYGQTRIIRINR